MKRLKVLKSNEQNKNTICTYSHTVFPLYIDFFEKSISMLINSDAVTPFLIALENSFTSSADILS